MASTYSTNLGIELIGTGDQSGTWGATTNTNFGTLVEQAIVGYSTQAVTDSGSATVLTIANGASSTGRNYVVELTGTLTTDRTVTVPAVNKPYVFYNNTIGGFSVTVKVSGQTGVVIANGKKAIVYTNTTDVIEVANAPVTEAGTQTLTNKTLTSPVIGTVIGGTTASSTLTLKSTSGVGTTDSIAFKVGNNGATTAMTVTTAGDVGIGVTSPAAKLDVAGTIYSRPGNAAGALAILTADATSGTNGASLSASFATGGYGPLKFLTSGSESMRIAAAGNVGIGTASPGVKLEASSGSTTTNTTGQIRASADVAALDLVAFGSTATAYGMWNASEVGAFSTAPINIMTTGATAPIKFAAGGNTEQMRITSAGNVGIGTTSPSRKLDIQQISTDYQLRIGDTSNYYDIGRNTSNGLFTFYGSQAVASGYVFSTVNGERMRIDTSGNVGIGDISATIRLLVKGASSTSSDYALYTINGSSQATLVIRNDGYISTGGAAASPYNLTTGNAANVYVDSAGGLSRSTSSLRYKNSIQDAAYGLADVLKLRAVTYKNNNDGDNVFGGFIAEEVDATGLKEFVSYDKEGRPDALHYANMAALMAKAIQELSAKNDALEARLAKLETV